MIVLVFAFWVALNGRFTWEIMGLGAAVTALAMFFLCRCCDWSLKKEAGLYKTAPQLILYAFVVILEIVKANLALCRLVYRGRPEPLVRVIRTELKTRFGKMLLANSITLTPGTITVDIRGDRFLVHCLDTDFGEGLQDSAMEARILTVEKGGGPDA